MSAPLAGKFQDHYAVLGVDPQADSDAIQQAYTKLAKKYHPRGEEANAEKFEAINLAFETLSDANLRTKFDKIKGVGPEEGPPTFDGVGFFQALGREAALRTAVLCILYDRRRSKPFTPSLSVRNLENLLTATEEELNFALWYLKQRSFVVSDDKSALNITVTGIDYLETNRPSPEVVLPLIRKAPAGSPAPGQTPANATQNPAAPAGSGQGNATIGPAVTESVRDILRRRLARA